jgi:hypothetical protein
MRHLVALLLVACAGSANVEPDYTPEAADPVTEIAPEAEPAPAIETSPAPEAPATAAEPDFMTECVASGLDVATCHGLESAWKFQQTRTEFLECCMRGGLTLTVCRGMWLSQTQAWIGTEIYCAN